jgi:hypothetical protein
VVDRLDHGVVERPGRRLGDQRAAEAQGRGAVMLGAHLQVHLERRWLAQRDPHRTGRQPAEPGQPAGEPAAVGAAGRPGEPGGDDQGDRVAGTHRSRG